LSGADSPQLASQGENLLSLRGAAGCRGKVYLLLLPSCLDCSLGRCESCNGHAGRRAAHVSQAGLIAEIDEGRMGELEIESLATTPVLYSTGVNNQHRTFFGHHACVLWAKRCYENELASLTDFNKILNDFISSRIMIWMTRTERAGADRFMMGMIFNSRRTGLHDSILKKLLELPESGYSDHD
jgi:hypothetical protein